jgi:hypothetical protein
LFESGQLATASNYGRHEEIDTIGGDAHTPWNFAVGDFNIPMDFEARGPSFSQPCVPEEPIIPYNIVGEDNTQLHPTAPPCSCLATMYLALSSLQELPSEVGVALKVVRAAVSTAEAVLRCEQCGRCGGTATAINSSTEAYQNTMLLNTLLPIIVNCYKRLRQRVDCEANRAKSVGNKMSLKIFQNSSNCGPSEFSGEANFLNDALMDPDDWRTAVHRLIQADVYGHETVTPGLKGIVSEMEHRQRSGYLTMDKVSHFGMLKISQGQQCNGEQDAPCLRILEMTKVAMESLAIS